MRLEFQHLAVEGELDVGREGGVDLGVKTYIVTAVDEPRLTGSYPTGKGHGLVERLVGVMGRLPQRIDDEGVDILQERHLGIADGLHVGNID